MVSIALFIGGIVLSLALSVCVHKLEKLCKDESWQDVDGRC